MAIENGIPVDGGGNGEITIGDVEPVGAGIVADWTGGLIDLENANDLNVDTGTSRTSRMVYPSVPRTGVFFDGATFYDLITAGDNDNFRLAGTLTIEMLLYISEEGSTQKMMIGMDGFGNAEADNMFFQFQYQGTANGQLAIVWEHDGGVDEAHSSVDSVPQFQVIHIAVTRDGTGQAQFYLNGQPLGPRGASKTLPTGGGTSTLFYGRDSGNVTFFGGEIYSTRVYNVERSAAQILAASDAALPGG